MNKASRLTVPTAEAVQRAVREHAAAQKVSRLAVEMELKRLVRHEGGLGTVQRIMFGAISGLLLR
ncbi:hypothetical protein ACIF6K_31665 [Streptomyces sp. NPDC085942]|uniref:hypothetical protein n=1 Tax=Streptomyces sp. NPDC085942 TaxID=3365743 RepID=UPI0037D343D5